MNIASDPLALSLIVALPLFGVVAKFFGASFRWIARWYLYITTLAVLVVLNGIFFPFIGGKDYFFRLSVQLSLIAFMFFWAFEARDGEVRDLFRSTYRRPLVIAVTVFVIAFMLAVVFAYDFHAAFWSNYERGEGGFQMLHYYAFFILLTLVLRKEEEWKSVFRFSLVAAGGMILYGLAGNFAVSGFIGPYTSGGVVPSGWWTILTAQRFQGSLGNPAYVAPYLLFAMFFAAYLGIQRLRDSSGVKTNFWQYGGYPLLIVIFLFFFYLSQTRGAFLGLGAGLFALVLYFIFAGHGSLRKWSLIALILLVAAAAGVYSIRNSNLTDKIPGGRLLQISFSDSTAQTRFWVWGEAWKGFKERPVFGWGPENFTAVYDKYFDPRFYVPGQNTETWFDRAHSVYFDYLSETGILGLLGYLGIFGVFFFEFFFGRKDAAGNNGHILIGRGLMLALPVAYLVQGVAIFDVLPMYLPLFLFLGFANYSFYEKNGQNR